MAALNHKIYFKGGYKYQLAKDYRVQTGVKPQSPIFTTYVNLYVDGLLEIKAGYAWDGPSGPTIDTQNFMRGSLVHDALYGLMAEGHLDPDIWRSVADCDLVNICREDGMSAIRAKWVYLGVRIGGGPAARNPRKILEAP